jgi:hypothetical protein
MKLTSVFRSPEGGVGAGLATLLAVYFIYNASLPPMADVRVGPPNDGDIESCRKGAAVKSGALIGLVFMVTRDMNQLIISGMGLGGIDYMYKHHNAFNSGTGKLEGHNDAGGSGTMASVHPMPEYSQDSEEYA